MTLAEKKRAIREELVEFREAHGSEDRNLVRKVLLDILNGDSNDKEKTEAAKALMRLHGSLQPEHHATAQAIAQQTQKQDNTFDVTPDEDARIKKLIGE